MKMAEFESLDLAVKHCRENGGWIFAAENGRVFWFNSKFYTLTPVLQFAGKVGAGKVGTYVEFLMAQPSLQVVA